MKLAVGREAPFEVDSLLEWNPSGIEVEEGQEYALSATVKAGTVWKDKTIGSSLDKGWGWPARVIEWVFRKKARAPGFPMYSLVGSIGKDPRTFFLIGKSAQIEVHDSGEVHAFANDWPRHYKNNHGLAEVIVRRLR